MPMPFSERVRLKETVPNMLTSNREIDRTDNTQLLSERSSSPEWRATIELSQNNQLIEALLAYWKSFGRTLNNPMSFAECLTVTANPLAGEYGEVGIKLLLVPASPSFKVDAHGDLDRDWSPATYLTFSLNYFAKDTVLQKGKQADYPGKYPDTEEIVAKKGLNFLINPNSSSTIIAHGLEAFLDLLASSIAQSKAL